MKKIIPIFLAAIVFGVSSCQSNNLSYTNQQFVGLFDGENNVNIGDKLLKIHHLYFAESGDSTLIQVGEKNILIDTGPKAELIDDSLELNEETDVKSFYEQLNDFGVSLDTKLDYVFITHQDDDHIGNYKTLLTYKIGTLVDFDSTIDSTVKEVERNAFSSRYSVSAKNYIDQRNALIKIGQIENYLSASQCTYKYRKAKKNDVLKDIKNNNAPGNTKVIDMFKDSPNVFTIGKGQDKFEIKVLYNVFNSSTNGETANDIIHNNMSVCLLCTYHNDKFLFTGDLMEFTTVGSRRRVMGETYLVQNNYSDLKDGVMYFRGGHHGSSSSNSKYFMSVIRPQYVFWNGGSQSKEFNFPTQTSIFSVGNYTDRIYFDSIDERTLDPNSETNKTMKLYGQSTFTYNPNNKIGEKVNVEYEKTGEPDSFFLSSLFSKVETTNKDQSRANAGSSREVPLYIYNLTDSNVDKKNPIDCTYIKIGHIDILLGAGSDAFGKKYSEISRKIKYLCNDKVLDYVIIPFIGKAGYNIFTQKDSVLFDSDYRISNVIYRDKDIDKNDDFKALEKALNKAKNVANIARISTIFSESNGEITLPLCSNNEEKNSKYKLKFLAPNDLGLLKDGHDYSTATLLNADGFTYLNLGQAYSYGYLDENDLNNNYLLKNNPELYGGVDVFQAPRYGEISNNNTNLFYDFVSKIAKHDPNNKYAYSANDKTGEKEEKAKDGLTVLFNSTFYKTKQNNVEVHKYPSNLRNGSDGLTYSRANDGEQYNILGLCTLRTINNSSCVPFFNKDTNSESEYGDICLRVSIQNLMKINKKDERVYSKKITFGVNRNYAKESLNIPIMPFNIHGTFRDENSFGNRNKAIMLTIDDFIKKEA